MYRMTMLVLGDTRYFGISLAKELLAEGYDAEFREAEICHEIE